jgi:hypothetical protein
METPKNKRLVLTSVNQVIALTKNNPVLAEKLPKLGKLLDMPPSTSPKKSCNCGGRQNITTPDVNKQVTESILTSLGIADFTQIKEALSLDEICYYKRVAETGRLELICV